MDELINAATALISRRFHKDRHHIAAALRTKSGRIFSAVNLECYIGRIAVCAEAIAIGMAMSESNEEITEVVAVDRHGKVVSPCGMCREMIADYSPGARVIIPHETGPALRPIAELLPNKYKRS